MSGGWVNVPNGGAGIGSGYWQCSHVGCKKKANPTITEHHCCGRCTPDCLRTAQGFETTAQIAGGGTSPRYGRVVREPGGGAAHVEPYDDPRPSLREMLGLRRKR